MPDYCTFSRDHKCPKYLDYELTRYELAELDELCHGNWIEITRLRGYIDVLIILLNEHGIAYPSEWEI